MDARCHIELFGGLRLRQGERVLTRFRTHKAATILAYLALHLRQSHPRDQLVDLFWPEMELEAGRVNLSTALTSLRRQLESPGLPAASLLVADRRNVQLNPEAVATDVAEFDALLDAASRAEAPADRALLLERAVGLYQGELLPGCLEEWALLERARCSERCVDALEKLAAAREETGDLEGALAAARRAMEADPYREEPYRAQMRLLATQGRVAAALETYRTLEQVLQAELGISPAAATRELAEQIQRNRGPIGTGSPAQATRPQPRIRLAPAYPAAPTSKAEAGVPFPSTLPLQLTRCFGREVEIADLTRRLGEPETRLVTLTGPGGAGKTRLAIEVAGHVAPAFEGRVWFVELAALPDPHLIPFALAHALKLPLSPDKDPLETVVETLADTPCLLLLDNFEHLLREVPGPLGPEGALVNKSERPAGGTALVRLLLERVPRLTLLATSRQPLHLGGEQEFPVPPLGMPTGTETPERLLQWGSVALYADRAQSVKPDFAVTERNAKAVAGLCRKLEGMPLAIEMAAAWVKTLPPARILERLERQLELLVSRRRDLPPRHQSLRATIEWSYGLLTAEQQGCFGRLSVFRGGWSLEAAEAVCGGEALRLLSELHEQSFVVMVEEAAPRYRLLEPLREYAAEKLTERGEAEAARNQHLAYFLKLAEAAAHDLHGADPEAALALLGSEMDNFRAAMTWAQAPGSPPDASLRLTAALWPFWEMRGYPAEGREHLRAALNRPGLPVAPERAQLLLGAATLAFVQVDLDEALVLGRESLARFRARDDLRGMAAALLLLGHVTLEQDEIAAANALLAEGLDWCHRSGWTQGQALACVHLGIAAMKQGDSALARSHLEQGLSLAEAVAGTPFTVALSLHYLGCLAMDTGDHDRAGSLLEKSLAIWRRLGHKHRLYQTLRALGPLARHQGDLALAVSYLEEAVTTCREQGNRTHLAIALYELGNVFYEQGAYERARPVYAESLDLFTQADSGWVPGARNNLGSTFFHLGDPIRAKELHREALRIYQRKESAEGIAWSLERLGVVEARRGDARKAVRLLAAASAVREGLGIPMARWDQSDWDEAVASLRARLTIREFDAAWAEGRALTRAQAIGAALDENEIRIADREGS